MNLVVVLPRKSEEYTSEYLSTHRKYLFHIIKPNTKKTFCGCDAHHWLMPYLHLPIGQQPTVDRILDDSPSYCMRCIKSMSIWFDKDGVIGAEEAD